MRGRQHVWQRHLPLAVGAVFAALAWACKPWCAALLPLCWVLRGVRAGAQTTAAVVLAMVILPEILMPGELMRDYRSMNLVLANSATLAWNNVSVLSIVERFARRDWSQQLGVFGVYTPHLAQKAIALGAVALTFSIAAFFWWRRKPTAPATGSAWLALMLLPVGVCWIHYFLFALPVACFVAFSARLPWLARASAVALLALVPAMEVVYGLTPEEFVQYQTHPAGLPWIRTVPMALVACTSLSALWYGGRSRNGLAAAPNGSGIRTASLRDGAPGLLVTRPGHSGQ